MCFSIPLKVIDTYKNKVRLEGGQMVQTSVKMRIKKGDYLQVTGDLAVAKISAKEGLKIRKLIKNLYYND